MLTFHTKTQLIIQMTNKHEHPQDAQIIPHVQSI